jgi:hypothetical protein
MLLFRIGWNTTSSKGNQHGKKWRGKDVAEVFVTEPVPQEAKHDDND